MASSMRPSRHEKQCPGGPPARRRPPPGTRSRQEATIRCVGLDCLSGHGAEDTVTSRKDSPLLLMMIGEEIPMIWIDRDAHRHILFGLAKGSLHAREPFTTQIADVWQL